MHEYLQCDSTKREQKTNTRICGVIIIINAAGQFQTRNGGFGDGPCLAVTNRTFSLPLAHTLSLSLCVCLCVCHGLKSSIICLSSSPSSFTDQDNTCVKNCDNPDSTTHEHFEQPLWQTLNMFAGETLCLVVASVCAFLAERYGRAKWASLILDEEDEGLAVVDSDGLISSLPGHGHAHTNSKKKKLEGPLVLLLWIPTLCDMTASTVGYVGQGFFLLQNPSLFSPSFLSFPSLSFPFLFFFLSFLRGRKGWC